jgi:hypothetical protein
VVILRPERTDPDLDRALVHLQGELTAAGFAVSVVAVDEPVTPAVLRRVGEEQQAFATLTVLRANGNTTADVWIGDRVTGKTSVRTLATTSSERSGKILAIRAVDLLKTSLIEVETSGEPPPEVVGVAPPSRSRPGPRFAKPRASPVSPTCTAPCSAGRRRSPRPSDPPRRHRPSWPWGGVRVVGPRSRAPRPRTRPARCTIVSSSPCSSWSRSSGRAPQPGSGSSPARARTGSRSAARRDRPTTAGARRPPPSSPAWPGARLVASPNARFAVGLRALTFAPDPVLQSADEDHPMNRFALLGTLGLEVGL